MPQATNPSFSPPVEPVLNMGNIQGLAVPGLLKPHQNGGQGLVELPAFR